MQRNMALSSQLENRDYAGLLDAWRLTASQTAGDFNLTLWYAAVEYEIPKLIEQAIILTQRYDVVVTNPPYIGSANMDPKLSDFVKNTTPDSKSDLVCCLHRTLRPTDQTQRLPGHDTQHAWMFLSSFEKLREKLLLKDTVNMAHLGPRAFEEIGGEVVQTTSFVLCNRHIANYKGTYCRLIEPTTQQGKKICSSPAKTRYTAQQFQLL